MPEKPFCGLTVMTVGYRLRIYHVLSFLFFCWFFSILQKKLFFGRKNKVTEKLAKVITILVIHKIITAAETIVLCTTKYYSRTSLYYKVLLQRIILYYKVLLQYYFDKVLLQYHSVLQSTTPVLPCTTKYYSSTTLYYKVLLQNHSVLQSITPILFFTTK